MPYIDGTTWIYPLMKETLEKANMYTVEHYIRVRQANMVDYIASRPILPTYKAAQEATGDSERICWWSQLTQLPPTSAENDTAEEDAAEEDAE